MTKEEVVNKAIEIEFGLGNVRSIREHNSPLVKIAEHVYDLLHPSLPSNINEAADKSMPEEEGFLEIDIYGGSEAVYSRGQMLAMFKAGAEWMRGQDDKDLSEKIAAAYQLGLADKEKQMMSNAVEGWVAVDSDTYGKRRVTFFPQKPVRDVLTEYKYWAATRPRYESIKLDSNAFPNLKWEDEPKKVKLIIVKED